MYAVAITDFSAIPHWSAYLLDYKGLPLYIQYNCSLAEGLSFSARASFLRHSWRELQIGELYVLIIGSLHSRI